MFKRSILSATIASMLFFGGSMISVVQSAEVAIPVTIEKNSKVPLRVLTRPGAVLYADAGATKAIQSNIPTFTSYFVYTRPEGEARASGSGMYEVGSDDQGSVKGWIKGTDLFEWKQTMCLTFSHPDGRDPVLMFEDEDYLSALVNMSEDKRDTAVTGYYEAIDQAASGKKKLSGDFPIVSVEPKMSVDNAANFTLLPILDFRSVEFEGREARLLDILAVSSTEKDRKSSDLRTNSEYLASATVSSESQADKLKQMNVDVVWLIDTTRSMGPYIRMVKENMVELSKNLASDKSLKDRIAFGVWGYRDSATIEGLEYVTKNFTPQLQNVDDFAATMNQVKETTVDSVIFDEDVFSGVSDAIEKTAWRDNSVRIVILVGDAPGHELGHEWNVSGMDQNTLRERANQNNVSFYALHLTPARTKKFNRKAAVQFKALAANPGMSESMYWASPAEDEAKFKGIALFLIDQIKQYVANAKTEFAGDDAAAPATAVAEVPRQPAVALPEGVTGPDAEAVRRSLHAASVTWLGNEVNVVPPRDVEGWVLDKDLKDGTRQSLEVKLLITKAQLDSIASLLKSVLSAGETSQVSGEDFFNSLQAASAVAARDPDKLSSAPNLAKSGLIPDFLSNLPYKSRLMEMNNEVWESWGPDEQNAFLNNLESKIKAYAAIHDDTSMWIALNPEDEPDDYVAPVLLDLMP